MEILDLRLIGSRDLQPLLEEERAVWRDALRWDYSATASMVLRFMDSRALTGYAAMEGGRAVGYSFYVYENFKGLIGDFFISPAFRGTLAEAQLITHVLETLQAMPGIRRIEGQLVNLDSPAIRAQFAAQGFQSFDRQFLFLSLPQWSAPPALPPALREEAIRSQEIIHIEPWDARWFQAAAELIVAAYCGHVDSFISDQYRTPAGAARFLENIIRFPGCGAFLPEVSLLAFCEDSLARSGAGVPHAAQTMRRLMAMILTSVVNDRVAHITQLCVSPQQQGRGLGRRLILQAIEMLRERGFQGVTLTVTVSNRPAVELYRGLGFSPLSTFPAFAWEAGARQPQLTLTPKKAAVQL